MLCAQWLHTQMCIPFPRQSQEEGRIGICTPSSTNVCESVWESCSVLTMFGCPISFSHLFNHRICLDAQTIDHWKNKKTKTTRISDQKHITTRMLLCAENLFVLFHTTTKRRLSDQNWREHENGCTDTPDSFQPPSNLRVSLYPLNDGFEFLAFHPTITWNAVTVMTSCLE